MNPSTEQMRHELAKRTQPKYPQSKAMDEAHDNAIRLLGMLDKHGTSNYAKGGNVAPEKASEALGKHEGKTLMVTQADRTKVGGGLRGGPGFSGMQHEDPAYEGKAWGVMTPSMASTILGSNSRVPEGDAVWSNLIGTPEQHSSNQMVFDKLLNDFRKAANAGLLHPELHAKINERLSSLADKEGNLFFDKGADIMSRKTTGSADTFAKRRMIADLIGGHGVGGKKGQIGDYDKIMRNATDPALRDAPTHSIGNRLFGLSGETSNRPDLHPAFPQLLHGEDYGQTYSPVPKDVMLRDYMKKFQEEKNRKPGYMDLTLGYSPSQHLSEDFLTHLQKEGYADGGSVGPSQDEMLAHTMLYRAMGGSVAQDINPVQPDMPDGTSTDLGYYEGGPSDGAAMDPMQYRAAGGAIRPTSPAHIGVDEAPDMPVKLYMPPGKSEDGNGMPVGGVDFQPDQPGHQLAQAPQGTPGQPPAGMPGQPPSGVQNPAQAPQSPQGMPQAPQAAAQAPTGPQSNILQMTPQGQAMAAMRATQQQRPPLIKPGMRPAQGMPRMAKGGEVKLTTAQMKAALRNKKASGEFEQGKISDIGMTERPL